MADLLIEIGCEELPAAQLPKLIQDFSTKVDVFLQQARLDYRSECLQVLSTPRRLAALCTNLSTRQPDLTATREGPSFAKAVGKDGQPTPAAVGFAKACGVEVADLMVQVDQNKPEQRLVAEVTTVGQTAQDYLEKHLPKMLTTWSGYKLMRWGDGEYSFLRPVQSLIVMLDNQVVPCSAFGIVASNQVHGHRVHCPKVLTLGAAGDYLEVLQKQGRINPDIDKRKADIQAGLHAQLAVGERLEDNPELLTEVVHLVESPQILRGQFAPEFLQLPAAVIHEVINHQQKCFLIYKADGSLVNGFLIIANLESKDPRAVVVGNQKVVGARLSDAKFFVERDLSSLIADFDRSLADVIFHPKLGSMAAKVKRVMSLGDALAPMCGCKAEDYALAARHLKFDLVTQTVQEWPKLEGVFGGYLLQQHDIAKEVAFAVAEHTRPRYAKDSLPNSSLGLALALADRLDTMVGFAALEFWPSADKDAYGLRRLALAIVRLVVELQINDPVEDLFKLAAEQHALALSENSLARLVALTRDRQQHLMTELYGPHSWLLEGFRVDPYVPVTVQAKISAMAKFKDEPQAEDYWAVVKRVDNFLKGSVVATGSWQQLPGSEGAEIDLGNKLTEIRATHKMLKEKNDFYSVYGRVADLRLLVDQFFEQVLINVPEQDLKENRIALIVELSGLF